MKRRPGRPRNPQSLYLDLARHFRESIRSGEWSSGASMPAQRDLAKKHGVSQHTVRLAVGVLAREGRITPTGRRGWLVKTAPRSGLVCEDFVLELMAFGFGSCLRSSEGRALHQGIELGVAEIERAFICLPSYRLRESLPSHQILSQPLAGIVLHGQVKRQILKQYELLSVPVVLADRPGGTWKLHAVSVENEEAAHDATRRLIEMGHRRIAFVRRLQPMLLSVDEDSMERQRGYEMACREAGLPWQPDWVFNSMTRDLEGSPWLARLLKSKPKFTAVLAVDVSRANLVEKAAEVFGIKVPENLSIITFQGHRDPAPYAGPRFDFHELGRRAVHLLTHPRGQWVHERISFSWSPFRTFSDSYRNK